MQSKAATVEEYLAALPADRRAALSAVREVILANLDPDIQEGMSYGMIGYAVSKRAYPAGYHCDPKLPLPYAGLAAQKNHNSLYLMAPCFGAGDDGAGGGTEFAKWFRERWARSGKKLDMGKGCIRFKKLDDLALDVIGEAIKRAPARVFVQYYEEGLAAPRGPAKPAAPAKAARTTNAKKTTKVAAKATAEKATAEKATAKKSTAKKSTAKKSTAKKSTR